MNVVRIYASALLVCASLQAATPAEWAGKAERLISSGNSQEGLAALVKAAELPGASAELEDEIGFLFAVLRRHRQLGDFVAMIRELKAAIAIRPDYAEAHYIVGIGFKQTDDLDTALPELQEAIRLDPSTPGPFNTLGQILRIKGDKQGSAEAFATGARLKREKEGQLANTLEQGMRDGSFPKPLSGPPR